MIVLKYLLEKLVQIKNKYGKIDKKMQAKLNANKQKD